MNNKVNKPPERQFLEYGNLVYGIAGLLLAVVSYWTTRFEVVLGFIAGGGWVLVTVMFIFVAELRRKIISLNDEIKQRDDEIADLKQQTKEWRAVATADSDTLNKFVSKALPQVAAVARRR